MWVVVLRAMPSQFFFPSALLQLDNVSVVVAVVHPSDVLLLAVCGGRAAATMCNVAESWDADASFGIDVVLSVEVAAAAAAAAVVV